MRTPQVISRPKVNDLLRVQPCSVGLQRRRRLMRSENTHLLIMAKGATISILRRGASQTNRFSNCRPEFFNPALPRPRVPTRPY